ncbi:MAG TPA: glycosyltransferase family 2 protein [Candidatus Deferrimicrobium sp.]|nr:glycosyltransferase family 2 protein [Candidatus Deferrimicrobium sp.]
MKKLTIVIPTFNRKDSLVHLLETLQKQGSEGTDLTIAVVVDGSTDGTQEAIRSLFPQVAIIEGDGQWWWTKSVNEGCKWALKNDADAVLLLNDDICLDEDYLRNLLNAVEKEPQAIIGSINITEEKERKIFFSGAPRMNWWAGKIRRYHPFLAPYNEKLSGLHKTAVLPGRGMYIPAHVFEKVGYFDQEFLPQYKADYDFVLRAAKQGIPAFISWDAIIYTQTGKTGPGATFTQQSLSRFSKSLFHNRSRTNLRQNFTYYLRHFPRALIPIFPLTSLIILARQFFLFRRERKYRSS